MPEAVFRARLQRGKGFIPFPSKSTFYSLADKRIAIQENMSQLQTLKTAIHEIAHAEARHGKAFEGLLKRYFG